MKNNILRILLVAFIIVLVWGIRYAWISFPIITGFDAKEVCSCIFVSGRNIKDLDSSELAEFPMSLADNTIDFKDSSVSSSVCGLATQKAIYRKGLGCTLINDSTEETIRAQNFYLPETPKVNTDSIPWPLGDKIEGLMPAAIDSNKLKATVDKAFTEPYPDKKQRTRAVVVLYDGKLVDEKYAPGFTMHTKMYGWSMAKSFTAALIGTLVMQGKLDVNKPASVPEWSDAKDPRNSITLKNLLQQTSGLDFEENYGKASDITNMLYKKGDMAAFAASHSLVHKPGTVFNYSSGNSNILSRIVRQTVGEKNYASYLSRELFYKTGMYNTLLEPDASGTFVGSSYVWATARDFARFGLLYYNDGVSNGQRILPEGWVHQTATSPAANTFKNYGYQFWLNGSDKKNPTQKVFPDVPADMFYCDGYAYEDIYIIPSKKLVVVRLGLTLDNSFDENNFLKSIIDCIHDK